jgi:hypothetical protein
VLLLAQPPPSGDWASKPSSSPSAGSRRKCRTRFHRCPSADAWNANAAINALKRVVERFIDGHANADTIEWQKARDPRHVGASLIDGAMLTALQIREETESFTPGEFESYESTPDEFEAAFRRATPMGEKP